MDFINEKDKEYGRKCSSRTWIFCDFDVSEARKQFWVNLETKYMIYGNEICPDTKKPQLIGYVIMTKAYRWGAMKKLLGNTHFAKTKVEDGMNYCMKDMKYVIKDSRNQGARTDLVKMGKMVEEHKTDEDISKEYPVSYMRYRGAIAHLRTFIHMPDVKPMPKVYWHWGATCTGKPRSAYELHSDTDVWMQQANKKGLDGYIGQKVAVFDDIRVETLQDMRWLLAVTDWPDLLWETKGDPIYFRPEVIVITCPRHPDEECKKFGEDTKHIIRRCTEIIECKTAE